MAITLNTQTPTVGDTEPCPTCNHVKVPEKRLHEIACCGLDSHRVRIGFDFMTLSTMLGHMWREEGTYSAVKSDRDLTEAEMLSWLERAHAGETPRRPYIEGAVVDLDPWTD